MLTLLGRLFGTRPGALEALGGLSNALELGQDNEPPTEFRIFRAGLNTSDKGNFMFDTEAARSVMAAFAKKGTALTMDYEHMAASDPPQIAPASASSWLPEIRNGELWATNVNWTPRAREMIKAREYTRFSPLFFHDPKTMRVLRVLNCALTNVEALDNVQPLVAASNNPVPQGDRPMKKMACKACLKALKAPTDDDDGDEVTCTACSGATGTKMLTAIGLRVDVSDQVALAELSGLTSFRSTVMGLTGKGTAAEALGVIAGWKANGEELTALRARVEEGEAKQLRAEFDGVIETASKEGKLSPAEGQSLGATMLKLTGGKVTKEAIEGLKAHVATLGKKVTTDPTKERPGGSAVLTSEDVQIAKAMGNDPKDVEKYKTSQLPGGAQ